MFPRIRSTGSKQQSRLAVHAPFFCQLTARISIPSNNSSRDSNRSCAKRRRALLRDFGEQSPLFSKEFPKTNAMLISQIQGMPNLIEKCSSLVVDDRARLLRHLNPSYELLRWSKL